MAAVIDERTSDDAILGVLHAAADAVRLVLDANDDWSLSGERATQYSVDLRADAAALAVLHAAGFAVMSEESGFTVPDGGSNGVTVVLDPLDGSTNASRRVPWYATALCAVDAHGMRASVVVNQAAANDRWWASRGGGAFRNGTSVQTSECVSMSSAVVGVSGLPRERPGWAQFRALGAAALDICLVASGSLDAWIDFNRHGAWDYLASLLVLREAGGADIEFEGRDPIALGHDDRRTVLVAATPSLLDEVLAVRRAHQRG
jgi:fructose-1,6-bisphosphatase/inositol monophosphatase family enzyme